MKPVPINAGVTGIIQLAALAVSLMMATSSAKPQGSLCSDSSSAVQGSCLPNSLSSSSKSVGTPTDDKRNGEEQKTCSTPGCVEAAARILKNMNPNVRPCDDFYEFACGGFEESTIIPDDRSSYNIFDEIDGEVLERLRASIEEPSRLDEQMPFTLAKNLYKSCMDTSTIEKRGSEPLLKSLNELGTWPVIGEDNWKEDEFHWTEVIYKFRQLGYSFNYFISFSTNVDMKDGTKRIITLDQASLGLSRTYLSQGMENEVVEAYLKYMVDVAVMLGANREKASQELRESLEFETKLANISLPHEKRRDSTLLYNPMTIAELNGKFPGENWKDYINKLLPSGIRVDENEVVIVAVPSFLNDLMELLRTTPKRVQANYLLWSIVRDSVQFLTEDFEELEFNYSSVVDGKKKKLSRWKECTALVKSGMSISVGALYVRKYLKEDAKRSALEMVAGIKKELMKTLETIDWMDENTKNSALEKAAAIHADIAYPEALLDDDKLDEYYSDLELRDDDYFGNIRNLALFKTKHSFSELKKPVNKRDWVFFGTRAIEINAYYSTLENTIAFPAGILQGPIFSNDCPRYMSYGGIGYIMSHEITHGFDNLGKEFDKDGNLKNWWAPKTEETYLKKAECIIHQYGNYTVESVGLNLNGINTERENIADNAAVKLAYMAYKEWVKQNGPEPNLPGLNYTVDQMFWISAANDWCMKFRPEELKSHILTNPHSPGRFRVLGPFSNSNEFSKDFDCPVGSPMNPKHKCSVW